MKLYKRKVFSVIQRLVEREKSLVITGGRQVGKSSVLLYLKEWLERQGKRTVFYDLNFSDASFNLAADLTAKGVGGDQPVYVLVDNWRPEVGGELDKNFHLVAASAVKAFLPASARAVEVLPLSFAEFLEFKAADPKDASQWPELYREFVSYGGFPAVVLEPVVEQKKQVLWQIVDLYLRKDLSDLARIKDPTKFYQLLSALAGRSGQVLDMMALTRELKVSFPTLKKYLAILEQTLLVQTVKPYSRQPEREISKSPKVYFLDSGLMSLLWLNQFSTKILEPVFATNVFAELVKKVGREAVGFWRTKAGAEVDFVVEKGGGDLPAGRQILAVEAEVNFDRFSPKDINSFKRRYDPKRWRVIGLTGEKMAKNGFYPWEM